LARLRRLGTGARVFARLKPVVVKQDDGNAGISADADNATETNAPAALD
jgi:hypothetical protein